MYSIQFHLSCKISKHQVICFLHGRQKPGQEQLENILISHNKLISSIRENLHFPIPNRPLA